MKKILKMVQTNSMNTDRRKNNYNLFFTSIFILLFILIFINKLILINIDDKIDLLNEKFDKFLAPIENVELPTWEDNL
jgi:hypothetical protein